MEYTFSDYQKSAESIKNKLDITAKTAVVLGSGLGNFAGTLSDAVALDYSDIYGFKTSTVDSHAGKLIAGYIDSKQILVMSGRFHFYEGYDFADVAFPVRVMKLLGIENIVLTNAAGGINPNYRPGDFMLISDHIKLTSQSPVIGKNISEFGIRFFDMSNAYCKDYRDIMKSVARNNSIKLHEGVYAFMAGPQFETPAEIKMLSVLGADAVGMSTVAEAITAVHCGIKVAGISCISNMAAGISDIPVSDDDVTKTANSVGDTFCRLVTEFIRKI